MQNPRSFRPHNKLRKSNDFRYIKENGMVKVTKWLVFTWVESPADGSRLGFSVSRRVGNAVARNQIKRLLREWFRMNKESFTSTDLHIIVRAPRGTKVEASVRKEGIFNDLQKFLHSRQRVSATVDSTSAKAI